MEKPIKCNCICYWNALCKSRDRIWAPTLAVNESDRWCKRLFRIRVRAFPVFSPASIIITSFKMVLSLWWDNQLSKHTFFFMRTLFQLDHPPSWVLKDLCFGRFLWVTLARLRSASRMHLEKHQPRMALNLGPGIQQVSCWNGHCWEAVQKCISVNLLHPYLFMNPPIIEKHLDLWFALFCCHKISIELLPHRNTGSRVIWVCVPEPWSLLLASR